MKAYVATAEYAQLVCASDKNPSKSLKKIAKFIDEMQGDDERFMLTGINVGYDDDGVYNITATVSTIIV